MNHICPFCKNILAAVDNYLLIDSEIGVETYRCANKTCQLLYYLIVQEDGFIEDGWCYTDYDITIRRESSAEEDATFILDFKTFPATQIGPATMPIEEITNYVARFNLMR